VTDQKDVWTQQLTASHRCGVQQCAKN